MKKVLLALIVPFMFSPAAFSADSSVPESADKAREEMKAAGVADPGKDVTVLNMQGYKALYEAHDFKKALNYFRWNIALFPSYGADLYDSLGDGYLEAGDAKHAIEAYSKSLEINPGKSDNGADVVAKLKADPKNLKDLQEASRKLNSPGMASSAK